VPPCLRGGCWARIRHSLLLRSPKSSRITNSPQNVIVSVLIEEPLNATNFTFRQGARQMLGMATAALQHAYAPYSKFRVGATVITDDGHLYTGSNVENASYGLTICAERAAIFNAVHQVQGKLKLKGIAIVTENDVPCPPCGACRQVIAEFGANTAVVFRGQTDYMNRLHGDEHRGHVAGSVCLT
jgi:cytidine deaminase